jgi:hypothetical protein
MHLTACDQVDAGGFLLEDGRLAGAELRIGQIAFS